MKTADALTLTPYEREVLATLERIAVAIEKLHADISQDLATTPRQ